MDFLKLGRSWIPKVSLTVEDGEFLKKTWRDNMLDLYGFLNQNSKATLPQIYVGQIWSKQGAPVWLFLPEAPTRPSWLFAILRSGALGESFGEVEMLVEAPIFARPKKRGEFWALKVGRFVGYFFYIHLWRQDFIKIRAGDVNRGFSVQFVFEEAMDVFDDDSVTRRLQPPL